MACVYSIDGGKTFIDEATFKKYLSDNLETLVDEGDIDVGKLGGGERVFAAKNASIAESRERFDLNPIIQQIKSTDAELVAQAAELVDKVDEMVSKAIETKRYTFTDAEQIALSYKRDVAAEDYGNLNSEYLKAKEEGQQENESIDEYQDRLQQLENDRIAKRIMLDNYDQTLRNIGTTSAKVLRARQLFVNRKMDAAYIINEMKADAKGGELPSGLEDEVYKIIDGYKKENDRLKKLTEEQEARESKLTEEFEAQKAQLREELEAKIIEAAKSGGKKQETPKKKSFSPEKEARLKELKKQLGLAGQFNDATNLIAMMAKKEFYEYNKLVFERAAGDFKDFSKEMIATIGKGIKQYLPQLFKDAGGTDEQINASKKSDIELDGEFKVLAEQIGVDAEGEFHEGLLPLLNKMLKNRVEAGETDYLKIINDIHEEVSKHIPDVSKSELRDLISGYGKFKALSKDEIIRAIAEMKNQMRLDAKVEATERNELPLRNGLERAKQSQATREKNAKILKNIKEKGIQPKLTEAEKQAAYATALEAHHRRLQNAIDDIQKEIDTNEKRKKSEPKKYTDERSQELERDKARLIKERDAKFAEPQKSELEKLVKRQEAITKKIGEAKKVKDVKTEEQLKIEADLVSGEISNLMKSLETKLTPEEKRLNKLQEELDSLQNGTYEPTEPKEKREKSAKEKELIEAIEKQKELLGYKEAKPTPEQQKVNSLKDTLKDIQDEIDNLKSGKTFDGREVSVTTKNGEKVFGFAKEKKDKVTSERIVELENLKEGLKVELSDLLPQAVKDNAVIDKALKQRKRRLAALEEKIRIGQKDPSVFDVKKRMQYEPISKDADVQKLQKEKEAVEIKIKEAENKIWEIKEEHRLANRSTLEVIGDKMNEMARNGAISNPMAIPKIFSSGLITQVMRPFENIIGAGAIKLLPTDVQKQASIEGKLSGLVEMRAIAQILNKANWNDAWTKFKEGKHREDKLYGQENHPETKIYLPTITVSKKGIKGGWTKEKYSLAFSGRFHAFAKTVPYKMGYFRNLEYATAWAIENHPEYFKQVGDEKVLTDEGRRIIETQAYLHGLGDAFLNEQAGVKAIRNWIARLERSEEKSNKATAWVANNIFKVLNVGANYFLTGLEYIPVYGHAKAQLGARSKIEITPERANMIARTNKRSTVGIGLMLLGYALPNIFGGYDEDEEKNSAGVKAGEVQIGKWTLPHWLTHTPLMIPFQLGATLRRYTDSDASEKRGFKLASNAIEGVLKTNPFSYTAELFGTALDNEKKFKDFAFEEMFGQWIPAHMFWKGIADLEDKDEHGKKIRRVPDDSSLMNGFTDRLKIATGFDRESVMKADNPLVKYKLSKEDYEQPEVAAFTNNPAYKNIMNQRIKDEALSLMAKKVKEIDKNKFLNKEEIKLKLKDAAENSIETAKAHKDIEDKLDAAKTKLESMISNNAKAEYLYNTFLSKKADGTPLTSTQKQVKLEKLKKEGLVDKEIEKILINKSK